MSPPRFPFVRRVLIENFRSIRKLDVQLPPFAVLVGPNGSGKTNFVLALSLLGDLIRRGSTEPAEELGWDEIVRRTRKRAHHMRLGAAVQLPPPQRESPENDATQEVPLEVELELDLKPGDSGAVQVVNERFRLRWGDDSVEVRVSGDEVSATAPRSKRLFDLLFPERLRQLKQSLELQPTLWPEEMPAPEAFLQAYYAPRALREDIDRRYLRLLSMPRFYSEPLAMAASACAVTRVRLDATALRADAPVRGLLGEAGQGLAAAVAELRGLRDQPKREFETVLRALREVFPGVEDVVPVRTGPGRLALTFRERGVAEPFAQASVSDGVMHALALLMSLAGPSHRSPLRGPGLLAIEEPENAIHPWSIAVLMERMQRVHRRQLLITTHSIEVVNQVKDPGALLICEVHEDGTRVEPALNKQRALSNILKQSGQRLGEVWHSGELGGVPGEVQ